MSNVVVAAMLIALLAAYVLVEFSIGRLAARSARYASRRLTEEYRRANRPDSSESTPRTSQPKGKT